MRPLANQPAPNYGVGNRYCVSRFIREEEVSAGSLVISPQVLLTIVAQTLLNLFFLLVDKLNRAGGSDDEYCAG